MEIKATIEVTGAPADDFNNYFFEKKIEVSGATIGESYDKLVEAAQDLYMLVSLYLMEHFESDYDFQHDYWYVNCSWSSPMNPYNEEASMGAGGALVDPKSLVASVVHYRHMEIESFLKRESSYLRDGYYKQYMEKVAPLHDYFELYDAPLVSDYSNYGYLGTQLDQVIKDMGPDYVQLLKDYDKYRGLISRGPSQDRLKLILPKALPEIKPSSGSITSKLKRLFARAR